GDACIDGVAFQGHPKLTWMGERRQVRPTTPVLRDIQADVQPEAGRIGHAHGHALTVHHGFDHAGRALEPHLLRGDPLKVSEAGNAASSVPAELGLSPIAVVEAPTKMSLRGFFDEDEPVRPDREVPRAYAGHERRYLSGVHHADPVVHHDEIVAGSVELHERYLLQGRSHSLIIGESQGPSRRAPGRRTLPALG